MLKNIVLFFLAVAVLHFVSSGQEKAGIPDIGVCVGAERAHIAQEAGFDYIVPSVSSYLVPLESQDVFAEKIKTDNPYGVKAINSFLPGNLPCFGPEADRAKILEYAQIVFERASLRNVPMIVLGSGRARNIPDGVDREDATRFFVELCKELADMAQAYNIQIALENLNKGETNFVNTVQEAAEICKRVDRPNFGINADLYHMLREEEKAEAFIKAAPYLIWCDVAEPANRTPPGMEGTDFRPYLHKLKELGYHGGITIEARWDDFLVQAPGAYRELFRQVDEVFK